MNQAMGELLEPLVAIAFYNEERSTYFDEYSAGVIGHAPYPSTRASERSDR